MDTSFLFYKTHVDKIDCFYTVHNKIEIQAEKRRKAVIKMISSPVCH